MTAVHEGRSTPVADRSHRVHWFAGRLHEVVDELTAGGVALLELDRVHAGETVVELLRGAAACRAWRCKCWLRPIATMSVRTRARRRPAPGSRAR